MGREEEGISSLRPELSAIARTLQATSLDVDLINLCDSEAALSRVSRWIGSGPRTTLAGDAIADIVTSIDLRESAEERTYIHVQSQSTSRRASQRKS